MRRLLRWAGDHDFALAILILVCALVVLAYQAVVWLIPLD